MSDTKQMPSVETLLDLTKALYGRAAALGQDAAAAGREAWLTGLGAVGVVETERAKFVDAIVDGRTSLARRGEKVEERLGERIAAITNTLDLNGRRQLQRFGVPSRSEVRELSAKVEALTSRVNTLIDAIEQASLARQDVA